MYMHFLDITLVEITFQRPVINQGYSVSFGMISSLHATSLIHSFVLIVILHVSNLVYNLPEGVVSKVMQEEFTGMSGPSVNISIQRILLLSYNLVVIMYHTMDYRI